MMPQRSYLLATVTCIILAQVYAESIPQNLNGEAITSRVKRQAAQQCGMDVMMSLEGCCDMPMILPPSAFQNCSSDPWTAAFNATGFNNTSGFFKGRWNMIRKRLREFGKQFVRNFRNSSSSSQQRADAMKRLGGNPICMFECVFKNQSLLTSAGKVDMKAVEKKLMSSGDSTWKPIIQEAIQNCSTEIAKLNISSLPTPPAPIKLCNLEPMLLTSCVHRYMIIECPMFASNSTSCSNNLKRLTACSVLPTMMAKPSPPPGGR